MKLNSQSSIFPIAEIALILLGLVAIAPAQQAIEAKAGSIHYMTGEVFLDGKLIPSRENSAIQIENGQILSTRKGHVELLLAPDAFLRMGEDASVLMRKNDPGGMQLELNQGSAMVEMLTAMGMNPIKIYISRTEVNFKAAGLYRLDFASGQILVYAGSVSARDGNRNIRIKRGKIANLDRQFAIESIKSFSADELHQWAARRSFEIFTSKQIVMSLLDIKNKMNWLLTSKGKMNNSVYRMSFPADPDWVQRQKEILARLSGKKVADNKKKQ